MLDALFDGRAWSVAELAGTRGHLPVDGQRASAGTCARRPGVEHPRRSAPPLPDRERRDRRGPREPVDARAAPCPDRSPRDLADRGDARGAHVLRPPRGRPRRRCRRGSRACGGSACRPSRASRRPGAASRCSGPSTSTSRPSSARSVRHRSPASTGASAVRTSPEGWAPRCCGRSRQVGASSASPRGGPSVSDRPASELLGSARRDRRLRRMTPTDAHDQRVGRCARRQRRRGVEHRRLLHTPDRRPAVPAAHLAQHLRRPLHARVRDLDEARRDRRRLPRSRADRLVRGRRQRGQHGLLPGGAAPHVGRERRRHLRDGAVRGRGPRVCRCTGTGRHGERS